MTPYYNVRSSLLPKGRERGLSLVELMIALLLGVILTLGATQIYLGSSQTYRLTDGIAHAQETVRFATSMMQKDIRSAGNLACLQSPEDIEVELSGDRVVKVGDGITGWEASNTSSGDSMTFAMTLPADASGWSEGSGDATFPAALVGNVVSGTDVVIVNAVETMPVTVQASSTGQIKLDQASGIPQGRLVLAVDDNCSAGELFQKANTGAPDSITMAGGGFDPGNRPASSFDLSYSSKARVAAYTTVAYYVGVGTGGEPSLFMQRLDSEPEAALELVEGVESMQVLYGIATSDIKRADRYVSADNVPAWSDVTSVRIAYMVRSGDNANSEDIVRTFNLLGTEITSPADRRARLLASTTIGLRNRLE